MRVVIVYDGQCPVCTRLTRAARLRDRASELELIDARGSPLHDIESNDLSQVDFDRGFAVIVDGRVFCGADGARALALITEPTGVFYWLFQLLTRGEKRSRVFYPVMRAGRSLLLRIMGVPRFSERAEQSE
ncbi:MAG: DUF393 domain-containing protein [Gammaproteobacteria bacterium]|jgi:predicted DCC family thiol-disulfide oxidoreductase YuxK|nr:DUF393 domain-containing protein [Gammaproteobacteria bacterium]